MEEDAADSRKPRHLPQSRRTRYLKERCKIDSVRSRYSTLSSELLQSRQVSCPPAPGASGSTEPSYTKLPWASLLNSLSLIAD